MIEFEAEETLRTVSTRESVYKFVVSTDKNYYSNSNVVTAKTLADYIRRYVWSKDDFDFPVHILDKMSQIPSKLGVYNCWADFLVSHSTSPAAKNGLLYLARPFSSYSKDIQQEIISSVEMRLSKMYDRYKANIIRTKNKAPIDIDEDDNKTIRFATVADIKLIADLAKRVYPCPINDFEVKSPWHEKNNYIFVVCLDEFGELLANINLLPLSESFYNNLKSGIVYEDKISSDDIYTPTDKKNVKHLYIEGFACISTDVQREFRRRFENIISKLADIKNKDLVICAIGGSKEGDLLMKKYKFTQTGWAIDPKSNIRYPFLETNWSTLKKTIMAQIIKSEIIKE
ncbi:MAG: hypothetical protein ABIN91_01600 [Mucilaginibacter sp.]|uniref:hypothetical protein n=1 Tax=Mucilaginibacter sp. TaxID=1882438 RepID=UPI003262E53E